MVVAGSERLSPAQAVEVAASLGRLHLEDQVGGRMGLGDWMGRRVCVLDNTRTGKRKTCMCVCARAYARAFTLRAQGNQHA